MWSFTDAEALEYLWGKVKERYDTRIASLEETLMNHQQRIEELERLLNINQNGG